MPQTLDITEARSRINTIDSDLAERPVIVVTRHNKEAFAFVDIEYLETILETVEMLSDPETVQMLQDSIEAIQEGRVIDHEDVERELG